MYVRVNQTLKCFQEEFVSFEANDPFSQTLMVQVDGLLGSFHSLLTEENYKSLVSVLVSEVAEQLEKAVFKSSFNRVRVAWENNGDDFWVLMDNTVFTMSSL